MFFVRQMRWEYDGDDIHHPPLGLLPAWLLIDTATYESIPPRMTLFTDKALLVFARGWDLGCWNFCAGREAMRRESCALLLWGAFLSFWVGGWVGGFPLLAEAAGGGLED